MFWTQLFQISIWNRSFNILNPSYGMRKMMFYIQQNKRIENFNFLIKYTGPLYDHFQVFI